MNRIVLLLVLACAIVAPKIGSIDFPVLILCILNLYLVIKKRANRVKVSKKLYYIISIWSILILWSIIIYLINGKIDSIYLLKPLRQIMLLILVFSIVRRTNISYNEVLIIVIIAALINTIVICLQLYGHNILGIQNFLVTSSFDSELDVPFRKPGLMAGYPHAGLLSVIAIICLLNFVKSIKKTYFLVILFLLSFSLVVTSRTALLLSFLPFSLLVIESLKSKRVMVRLILFMCIGTTGMVMILNALPEDTSNVAFEMFVNYSEKGKFTTESSSSTTKSYIIPEKISTYMFGNGLHNRTDVDTNIDDGYQVLVYGGGVFYFVITLLLFFSYFKFSLGAGEYKKVIYLIYLILLIANYKTDCIFSRVISDILVLFLSVSLNSEVTKKFSSPLSNLK